MADAHHSGNLQVIKGDIEKAQEYKEELMRLLEPVCALVTKAKQADKITMNFQLAVDAMGKQFVANLTAMKEL